MKVVQINTFPHKATGAIMMGIHEMLLKDGHNSYVVWGRGREVENDHEISIKDDFGTKFHGAYTRLTDKTGFASWRATKKLLKKLDEINPDIIHLHNIHGYFINIEMLFGYIRSNKIKVVWTLHDCWTFTGHCAYFDMVRCEKWKTGCHHCEQLDTYPASKVFDSSAGNWERKKELFTGLDITIVTPSNWLADLVKQSFLKEYPVRVIYNGIDLDVFKPTSVDGLKEKYCLDERPIVLGVASEWTPRKGLNDFVELSKRMLDIQLVVVGLTDAQMKEIPNTLKGIKRTSNRTELAGLYTLATLFFNPTYEDNFPTTNLEALACGTPVVTYDTGGSPETIKHLGIGKVIIKKNTKSVDLNLVQQQLEQLIIEIDCETKRECVNASKSFDKNLRLRDYGVYFYDRK